MNTLRFTTFRVSKGPDTHDVSIRGTLKKKHRIISVSEDNRPNMIRVHTVGEDDAEEVQVGFRLIPDGSTIEKGDLAKLAYVGMVHIELHRYFVFTLLSEMREHGIDRA